MRRLGFGVTLALLAVPALASTQISLQTQVKDTLPVTNGGTGTTTSTGTGAGVHATNPTISGATLTGGTVATLQPLDTQLTDLAALAYSTNALKVLRVNSAATGWELATVSVGGGDLLSTNNLSDLVSAATARTNLGLGTAAVQNTGTSGATVPLLNGVNTFSADQAITGSLTISNATYFQATFKSTASAGGFRMENSTNYQYEIQSDPANNLTWYDRTGAAYRFILTPGGNISLGNSNTDMGYTLGVNGTARFVGAVTTGSTIAATGAVTGSNLSGTNTGDQTITLTGNVTGTGTGSFATTIASIPSAATATTQAANDNTTKVATTAYVDTGLALKAPLASPTFTGTVSGVTAAMVGLGNVTNIAQTSVTGLTGARTVAAFKTGLSLVKGDVGLGSVDNTADTAKPVSTAQQTALNLKADLASPTFTGTPAAPTAAALTNTTQIATTAFVTTNYAPIANPVHTGVIYWQQSAPVAVNATGTLTVANLTVGLITTTNTVAVSLTLPTGTLTDAGLLSGTLAVDRAFDWYTINLGNTSGAITMVAGTGHTIVGSVTCAIATTCHWLTRKTAANTFVTYRL